MDKHLIKRMAEHLVTVVTDHTSRPSHFVDLPHEFDSWWQLERRTGQVIFNGTMMVPFVIAEYLDNSNVRLFRKDASLNDMEVSLVIANMLNHEDTRRFRTEFRSMEKLLDEIEADDTGRS